MLQKAGTSGMVGSPTATSSTQVPKALLPIGGLVLWGLHFMSPPCFRRGQAKSETPLVSRIIGVLVTCKAPWNVELKQDSDRTGHHLRIFAFIALPLGKGVCFHSVKPHQAPVSYESLSYTLWA